MLLALGLPAAYTPQGVTPAAASGTMSIELSFFGFWFVTGRTDVPLTIDLTNGLGIESNRVTATFNTQ